MASKLRGWPLWGAAIALGCVAVLALLWLSGIRVLTVESASIPEGKYLLVPWAPIGRSDVALGCVPASLAREARQRGYLGSGACYGGVSPIAKLVAGVAGDAIDESAQGVRVNGCGVRFSAPQAHDPHGRSIAWARSRVVPAGAYWLMGTVRQSFDSRYFGAVAGVRGRLLPLGEHEPPIYEKCSPSVQGRQGMIGARR